MEKFLPYCGPAFLVAVGFMDPGNWATIIEGGSRFGYELLWVVFFSTLLAMLLQTISARLGLITGKHFAQVCREEFSWAVCVLLWVICEISVITLDLTMVLGTAIGLNVVLQIPMLSSLFLMTIDSVLFIVLLPFLNRKRAEVIAVVVVGVVLLCFLLDTMFGSTLPLSMIAGFSPKLRHETLYTTISIVGASVIPHNFYLHSALVKDQSQGNQSLSTLSHYNFLGNVFAFSAVLVVNVAVLIVAVAGFHNAGLVVLTLQDAQALIEQVLNNSISPAVFGLALLCAGQLSTMNGSTAGQMVSDTLFDLKIRPWQHRVWIRGIALFPAATCVWRYGNEGTYQMLMFAQVFLALHLPFAIAPLIKVTSSERIMGSNKNSFYLETVAWLSLAILTAVNVTLVFDLVFGESEDGPSFGGLEYLSGFEWLVENGGENFQTVIFGVISMGTSLSLCFLVWLVFTPLQMDIPVEAQLKARSSWMEDYARQENAVFDLQMLGSRPVSEETAFSSWPMESPCESVESDGKFQDNVPLVIDSPHEGNEHLEEAEGNVEKALDPQIQILHSEEYEEVRENSSVQSTKGQVVPQVPDLQNSDEVFGTNPTSPSKSPFRVVLPIPTSSESTTVHSILIKPRVVEDEHGAEDGVALALEGAGADAVTDLLSKDDEEMDISGPSEQDDVPAEVLVKAEDNSASLQCEGHESGGIDATGFEGGSGSGSLSRLSGLGRAARRQFAGILVEFWSSLFDLHGQPLNTRSQGFLSGLSGCHADHTGGGSDNQDGAHTQKLQSKLLKSSWKKSNSTSEQIHNVDAYMLRTHTNAAASTSSQMSQTLAQYQNYAISPSYVSERRYSSLRSPSHHEEYDYQPATIHGYRTPSFPGRTGSTAASFKGRPLHLSLPISGSRSSQGRTQQMDIDATSLQEEYGNEYDSAGQQALSSHWARSMLGGRNVIDTEGGNRPLTRTEKHLGPSETSSYDSHQWEPLVYGSSNSTLGRWNPLAYRATGELDMKSLNRNPEDLSHSRISFGHSPIGRGGQGDHRQRAPLVFDELSPSQSHRDGFSIQSPTPGRETQSLWSRQPFEQLFGPTDVEALPSQLIRQQKMGSQSVQSLLSGNSLSRDVEIEQEILENLQLCVGKLLRLDGADWLFRFDNGADEDLIGAIAGAQKKFTEAETSEPYNLFRNDEYHFGEHQHKSHGRRCYGDLTPTQTMKASAHRCGNSCVWDGSLLVSFGVWCVHRILELSLMESRPELWGKYTYVLNRLQGILDPAFSKPRVIPYFCKCVNMSISCDVGEGRSPSSKQASLQDHGSGESGSFPYLSYPHPWPWGKNTSCSKGKASSALTFLDMIKEVETAVASRKGRTGTAAGDVAFPKGKENLASVLKRYKRRLSSKPSGSTGVSRGGRRV